MTAQEHDAYFFYLFAGTTALVALVCFVLGAILLAIEEEDDAKSAFFLGFIMLASTLVMSLYAGNVAS